MEHIIRPKAIILPDSSLVPEENRLAAPPEHYTHEVTVAQPFYFKESASGGVPNGEFKPGTKVALQRRAGADLCWVADGQGLVVVTAYDSLKPL